MNWSRLIFGFIFFVLTPFLGTPSPALSQTAPTNNDQLIFSIDVIRHGDRTPTSNIPSTPHVWSEGLGQLTALGMQQEHTLGLKLRAKYVSKLLPDSYEAGTMYVRSSDVDRTLMSAQEILLALYSKHTNPATVGTLSDTINILAPTLPHGYQPIPVHTVPRAQEPLLICDDTYNTVVPYNFQDLVTSNVASTQEWLDKEKELAPNFASWSQTTGMPINTLYDLKPLADTLFIWRLKGIALPAGLKEEDATTIIHAGHWTLLTVFKNPVVGKNTGAALLHEITNYFTSAANNAVAQSNSLKYVLFSGHETTLLSIMSALGTPLDAVPPYSSNLNFSLFSQGNNNYYIAATYNDQPVTFPCTGTTSCPLSQFVSAYGALAPIGK